MKKIAVIFCFWFIFPSLTLAYDVNEVNSLIEKHGKYDIADFILRYSGDASVTVQIGNKLRIGSGRPSTDYVTVHSIGYDLDRLGLTPDQASSMISQKKLEDQKLKEAEEAEAEKAAKAKAEKVKAEMAKAEKVKAEKLKKAQEFANLTVKQKLVRLTALSNENIEKCNYYIKGGYASRKDPMGFTYITNIDEGLKLFEQAGNYCEALDYLMEKFSKSLHIDESMDVFKSKSYREAAITQVKFTRLSLNMMNFSNSNFNIVKDHLDKIDRIYYETLDQDKLDYEVTVFGYSVKFGEILLIGKKIGEIGLKHFKTADNYLKANKIPSSDRKKSSNQVIGRWFDNTPYVAGTYTLVKKGKKIVMVVKFKDGSGSEKELIRKSLSGKIAFKERDGNAFEEYYLIEKNGNLSFYDREGFIRTIPSI